MGWSEVIAYCQAHGGVATSVAAAHAGGLHPTTVQRRAAAEGWPRPFPEVLVLPGTALDGGGLARAAATWIGPPVAITRWTAAERYGLVSSAPTRVAAVIPAGRSRIAHPRLELVPSRGFGLEQVRSIGGVPCVRPDRLVRDLAAVVDHERLRDLVIDLVQRRVVTLHQLVRAHAATPTYRGRGTVGRILEELGAAGRTDAGSELRFRRKLTAAGVLLDRGQIEVPCRAGRTLHLDLGIAALRFAIEVESMLAHATRSQLRTDVLRFNALTALDDDWRVLRATLEDLSPTRWPAFLALVREVIAAQEARLGGDRRDRRDR
jgi:hypothetical protein